MGDKESAWRGRRVLGEGAWERAAGEEGGCLERGLHSPWEVCFEIHPVRQQA